MVTLRRTRFVSAQLLWMVASVLALWSLGALSFDRFFGLSLVGLLVLLQLTAPNAISPEWRSRVRTLAVLGVVGFAVVVGWELFHALPSEVIP